jgi:hypothetical protein
LIQQGIDYLVQWECNCTRAQKKTQVEEDSFKVQSASWLQGDENSYLKLLARQDLPVLY